jgi:hypothetical protein
MLFSWTLLRFFAYQQLMAQKYLNLGKKSSPFTSLLLDNDFISPPFSPPSDANPLEINRESTPGIARKRRLCFVR